MTGASQAHLPSADTHRKPRPAFTEETATSSSKRKLSIPAAKKAHRQSPLPPPPPEPKEDEATPDLDTLRVELDLLWIATQNQLDGRLIDLGSLSRRLAELGEKYLSRNAPKAALECLRRAAKIAPRAEVPGLLSVVSVAAMRLDRVELAVRYLQDGLLHLSKTEGEHRETGKSESVDNVRAKLLLNLCVVFSNSGRYHEAVTVAEEAVTLLGEAARDGAPADQRIQLVVGLYNVCTCNEFLGQYSKAQAAAQRALRLSRGVEEIDAGLLRKLESINAEVGAKQRDQLQQAGRCARVQAWKLPPTLAVKARGVPTPAPTPAPAAMKKQAKPRDPRKATPAPAPKRVEKLREQAVAHISPQRAETPPLNSAKADVMPSESEVARAAEVVEVTEAGAPVSLGEATGMMGNTAIASGAAATVSRTEAETDTEETAPSGVTEAKLPQSPPVHTWADGVDLQSSAALGSLGPRRVRERR